MKVVWQGKGESSTESITVHFLRSHHPFTSLTSFHLFLSLLTFLQAYHSMKLDEADPVAAALNRRDSFFSCESQLPALWGRSMSLSVILVHS